MSELSRLVAEFINERELREQVVDELTRHGGVTTKQLTPTLWVVVATRERALIG